MFRLAASDFFCHIRIWVGALAVACACGFIYQYGFCLIGSAEQVGSAFSNMGLPMLLFSSIAAVPVAAAVGNLVVTQQRKSYALWQLAGVLPGTVRALVIIQLCMTGIFGALAGSAAASLIYSPTLPVLLPDLTELANLESPVELVPNWSGVIDSCALSAAVFVAGGFGSARRASKMSPTIALTEPESSAPRIPWLRILLMMICLGAAGLLLTYMCSENLTLVTNGTFFFPLVVVVCYSVLAPWFLPLVLRMWTVPLNGLVLPCLAKREAGYALASSTTIELPIMIGFGVIAGISSSVSLLGEWYEAHSLSYDPTLNQTAQVILFGCPALICLVGSMASALIASEERSRNVSSLRVMGMTLKEALFVSLLESLVHVINALIVGILAVCTSVNITALIFKANPLKYLNLASGLSVGLIGFLFIGLVIGVSTLRGVAAADDGDALGRGVGLGF